MNFNAGFMGPDDGNHNANTNIWSTKKMKWIKGPALLSQEDYYYNDFTNLCIIILNRTTVMLIGGEGHVRTENSFGTVWHYNINIVFAIDIYQNVWRRYPDIPFEVKEEVNLATGLNIDKLGNR